MILGDVVPHYLNVDLALGDIRVAKCIKFDYPCVPLEEAQGSLLLLHYNNPTSHLFCSYVFFLQAI